MKRLLAVIALLALACDEAPPVTRVLVDAGAPPGPSADCPRDDGVRCLKRERFFHDMPPENRVIDPVFDLGAGNWRVVLTSDFTWGTPGADIIRRFHRGTPGGLPVLAMFPGEEPYVVLGPARSGPGPLSVSVWLGRPPRQRALTIPEATVLGTSRSGADESWTLRPIGEPWTGPDGVVWRQQQVRVDTPPVGWLFVALPGASDGVLLATAPTVIPVSLSQVGTVTRSRPRVMTAVESRSLRSYLDVRKMQFGLQETTMGPLRCDPRRRRRLEGCTPTR